jgi:hypothetical protein
MPATVAARAAGAGIPAALGAGPGWAAAVAGDAADGWSVPAGMAGDAIAAMPAARRWARAEVAGAVRAVTAPLAEVTALPGEVTLLAGVVALVPGEVVVVPGEVPVPPGGVVPVPPGDGATAWPVLSTGATAEVTGVVTPLTVLVAVVTTAWPVPSTWVRAEVTGVAMLVMVPLSEVTVPWPVAAS